MYRCYVHVRPARSPRSDADDDDGRRRRLFGRSFQRDSEREHRRRDERVSFSLVLRASSTPSHARPRGTRRGIEATRHHRTCLPDLAARVHDKRRAGPVLIPPRCSREGAPWTRTRGRLARSNTSFPPARIVRGGGRARARRSARSRPVRRSIPGRRRRRETALTPLRSSSSFIISDDAHVGAARDGGPLHLLPSSSWIGASTRLAREDSGRVSRARSLVTGERPTIARTRAPGTAARKQSLVTKTTLSQAWSGNCIRGPQCAFEMSMFMCPAVHKLTRN